MRRYQDHTLSRRSILRASLAVGIVLPTAGLLAACDDEPDDLADDPPAAEAEDDDDAAEETEEAEDDEAEETEDAADSGDGDEMVINIAVVEEPPDIDPHNLSAAAAGLIGFVVMPGLVYWDHDLALSPMLAEGWEASDDGLEWTFVIRDNVVFHNGKECSAEEVVRNFENVLDPDSGSMLTPDFASVETVEAGENNSVVFTMSEPFAPFLAVLSHRVAITDMDDYDVTTPVGTGPFMITDWQRGSQVTLEKHDEYWEEGLPHADGVNWRFMPDADVRLTSMRAGEIDITTSVPAQMIEEVQSSGDFVVDPVTGVTHEYLAFNCAEGPFSDVRMRKAVAHAIDREAILEAALWGWGLDSLIPFPPNSPWYHEVEGYEHDLEMAQQLVDEAGFGDGLELDMPIPNWSPASEVAEIVQADLAQIGINLRLVETEWATYWPDIYLQSQFDITYMAYSARVDPDQTFFPRYHSEGIHNATVYSNERVDELLDEGRVTINDDERKEIYDEVMEILVDELPWLWLYLPDVTHGWTDEVEGYVQHPGNHVYLHEVRVNRS